MIESKFEREFCSWLRRRGCFVIKAKGGAGTPAGTPDRIVLFPGGGWAALEFKKSKNEPYQPLQEAQLARLKRMFYSATVYPENELEIKKQIKEMI